MTPDERTEPSISSLLALRQRGDAVRAITESLRVKEMGPADHIRTKHEVKAFVEAGDTSAAERLLAQVQERHKRSQTIRQAQRLRQGERAAP